MCQVHSLQVALSNRGYFCGDEDMEWWQFGSSTFSALQTFQVGSLLPVQQPIP